MTGVIAKDESGKYIQFNASKGVILATGDYMNNEAMVKRWCPDVDGYDKKQYQKTGDGHIMAIDAGAKMENLGHTKMMHDFDSGLMYEEPFLYVNMEGKRFCNEDTGFVYMGNITKYLPQLQRCQRGCQPPGRLSGLVLPDLRQRLHELRQQPRAGAGDDQVHPRCRGEPAGRVHQPDRHL